MADSETLRDPHDLAIQKSVLYAVVKNTACASLAEKTHLFRKLSVMLLVIISLSLNSFPGHYDSPRALSTRPAMIPLRSTIQPPGTGGSHLTSILYSLPTTIASACCLPGPRSLFNQQLVRLIIAQLAGLALVCLFMGACIFAKCLSELKWCIYS